MFLPYVIRKMQAFSARLDAAAIGRALRRFTSAKFQSAWIPAYARFDPTLARWPKPRGVHTPRRFQKTVRRIWRKCTDGRQDCRKGRTLNKNAMIVAILLGNFLDSREIIYSWASARNVDYNFCAGMIWMIRVSDVGSRKRTARSVMNNIAATWFKSLEFQGNLMEAVIQ